MESSDLKIAKSHLFNCEDNKNYILLDNHITRATEQLKLSGDIKKFFLEMALGF